MDPSTDCAVLEVSGETITLSSPVANADCSVEISQDGSDSSGSVLSHRAVLELTDDNPRHERSTIRRTFRTYQAIMRSYTSSEVMQDSTLVDGDGRRATIGHYVGLFLTSCRLACNDLFKCYQNSARKLKNNPTFIYILQFLLLSLSLSALFMGGTFFGQCPGSPHLAPTTIVTGFVAAQLVCQWMLMKYLPGDQYKGLRKCFILIFFIVVVGMLELEIYYFSKKPLSFEPSKVNYCNKVFYDYTYSKFIAAFVSMLIVVLLYIPDYRSYVKDMPCNDPITGPCCKDSDREDCNSMKQF